MAAEPAIAVRDRLGEALDMLERIGREHGAEVACWGHAGDGNVHASVLASAGGGCGADTVKDVVATAITELVPEVTGVVFDAEPVGPPLLQIGIRR